MSANPAIVLSEDARPMFTRGPWLVTLSRNEEGTTGYQILYHSHTAIAVDPRRYYPDGERPQQVDADGYYIPDPLYCGDHRVANAHLIAAAPELYEAMKAYCSRYLVDEYDSFELCGTPPEQHKLICAMFDALAKARGRELSQAPSGADQ